MIILVTCKSKLSALRLVDYFYRKRWYNSYLYEKVYKYIMLYKPNYNNMITPYGNENTFFCIVRYENDKSTHAAVLRLGYANFIADSLYYRHITEISIGTDTFIINKSMNPEEFIFLYKNMTYG